MNDNAKKLVDALRSNEFTQTTGSLRRGDSYCCLGVACELYRQEVGGEWEGDDFNTKAEDGFGWNDVVLPADVQNWLGFSESNGGFVLHGEDHSLSGCNDNGTTFKQIADLIELEPRGLFRPTTGE